MLIRNTLNASTLTHIRNGKTKMAAKENIPEDTYSKKIARK